MTFRSHIRSEICKDYIETIFDPAQLALRSTVFHQAAPATKSPRVQEMQGSSCSCYPDEFRKNLHLYLPCHQCLLIVPSAPAKMGYEGDYVSSLSLSSQCSSCSCGDLLKETTSATLMSSLFSQCSSCSCHDEFSCGVNVAYALRTFIGSNVQAVLEVVISHIICHKCIGVPRELQSWWTTSDNLE